MPTVRHPYTPPRVPSTPFLELLSATYGALRHAGHIPAQVASKGTCLAPGFFIRESLTAVLDVQHRLADLTRELAEVIDPGRKLADGEQARLAEQRAQVARYHETLKADYRFADMEMTIITGGISGIPWLTVKGVLRSAG
jgi:hypothetical protein